ncbi:TMEM175 family protein [Mucilaginibacter sp. KACC 22063]|uniref:TMEM175 family protein n=1 Tax=Mucilaginibacter sp. KACC 22063 TaxID=3025666 RepID=UPI002366B51E|nr:TMEM175 family protein [Mucilaginibacter sp. KACC 22063]WDF53609.1 TMEM175 family protein [Mucilaginibacter sp. KACC 22063]
MKKGRLEAFSDGVLAIIITIMVLELKVPHGTDFKDLYPLLPKFFSYILSFIYVGIYWNNHHHMIYMVDKINGKILWANLNLLFWLSIIPFVTAWMGENYFAMWPVFFYGCILLLNAIAYEILAKYLIRQAGKNSELAQAFSKNWKDKFSPVIYIVGIIAAFFNTYVSVFMYVVVAIIWFIPDKRVERKVINSDLH